VVLGQGEIAIVLFRDAYDRFFQMKGKKLLNTVLSRRICFLYVFGTAERNGCQMNSKIKIGWAEKDITPNQKIRIAGQFYERISDVVETPISVTALALESGNEQAVICSCDLACVSEGLVELVRAELVGTDGLDLCKVIIGATHTHTSYQYDELSGLQRANSSNASIEILKRYLPTGKKYIPLVSAPAMDEYEALLFLAHSIAEAIKEAWVKRDYGYFANEFGRAAVGMCRRVSYSDGSAKMWGDTNKENFARLEGGNDSGIAMLFFFDSLQKIRGLLVNVACPAQVLEQRSFISSDYWGKLKIQLRERFGKEFFLLALPSPAGDQCPRDLVRWVDPETPIDDPNVEKRKASRKADPSMYDVAGAVRIGRRLFYEINDAYESAVASMRDEAIFIHKVETLELPLRRATKQERDRAEAKICEYFNSVCGDINYSDNAELYVHTGTIRRYEQQQTIQNVSIELHVLRLGDMAMATNPFELFLDYGNEIRARSSADQTFLFQLTNGSKGYLPTEKAELGGHYSAYISSGRVGHEGGKMLVETTLSRIKECFEND